MYELECTMQVTSAFTCVANNVHAMTMDTCRKILMSEVNNLLDS